MNDLVTIAKERLDHLEERARKLAWEKSFLQLAIHLMNELATAPGLENTLETVLRIISQNIGGTGAAIYYWMDSEVHVIDIFGRRERVDRIEDDMVRRVVETRAPVETESGFANTLATTRQFGKAWNWGFPLVVGTELVGVAALRGQTHVHHLFVRADLHGQGIARGLWQRLKAKAGDTTHFTVNSSLYAVPTYAAFGFVPTAEAQARSGVRYQPMALQAA